MSARKHMFVVLNPVAGMVTPSRTGKRITQWCEQNGWTYDIYQTREDEDLSKVVKKALAHDCQAIVAAGGDGTISSVAAGMLGSSVPMVILPLGTGNLLAGDLGVPFDISRSLGLLEAGGRMLMLDAIQVNERICVLNAGLGFSSALIKNTERNAKRKYGFLAYIVGAVRALFGVQPHLFHLVVDNKRLRINASEIHIACGGLFGIQVSMEGVRVVPDDGRVDIFVIKARALSDYLEVFYYILRRKPRQAQKMIYLQAAEMIEIACEQNLPFQGDGEVLCDTPVKIRVLPNAIPVLVPEKQEEAIRNRLRQIVGV